MFAYLNEDKNFALSAFCSSAESKQLTNFVIHHLPNSLAFIFSLIKLIRTRLISEINVWVHFIVFYKNAKPTSKFSNSRKDLSFIHLRNYISSSCCLHSGKNLPACVGGRASLGQQVSSRVSIVLLVKCCSLSYTVFIFKVVWTLRLKRSNHGLWISRL